MAKAKSLCDSLSLLFLLLLLVLLLLLLLLLLWCSCSFVPVLVLFLVLVWRFVVAKLAKTGQPPSPSCRCYYDIPCCCGGGGLLLVLVACNIAVFLDPVVPLLPSRSRHPPVTAPPRKARSRTPPAAGASPPLACPGMWRVRPRPPPPAFAGEGRVCGPLRRPGDGSSSVCIRISTVCIRIITYCIRV